MHDGMKTFRDGAPLRSPVWQPEPGLCGGLLDPRQTLVPDWLVTSIDGHVRPLRPGGMTGAVRTACGHIDWEAAWIADPDLFWRDGSSGVPPVDLLWAAAGVAVELGHQLIVDTQVEPATDGIAVCVYGVGVEGMLDDHAWRELSSLLTTCTSTVFEPRPSYLERAGRLDDAPSVEQPLRSLPCAAEPGRRRLSVRVSPESRFLGDWAHTWWSYSRFGGFKDECRCPIHLESNDDFGPSRYLA